MSARELQVAVVCAHYGSTLVDDLVAALPQAEQAMFRAVDHRAFAADADRRHRAVAAVVEELPVSCAIAGLPAVYALFDDPRGLLPVVRGEAPMAVQFALALEPAVGDAARLEGAIARARRRRRRRPGISRAEGVEVTRVGAPGLGRYTEARSALGKDAVAVVCAGRRVSPWSGDDDGWVLATRGADGVDLASCSAGLGALLSRCEGLAPDVFISEARALGCDDDAEARALLDDLVGEGLLCWM